MMTQTFELTKKGTTERVLEWDSETEVDLKVQLKLLNNYPKYFEITTCKDNSLWYNMKDEYPARTFGDPPYPNTITTTADNQYHIGVSNRAFYGNCLDTTDTVLSGQGISGI
jgi:hypothetical protein